MSTNFRGSRKHILKFVDSPDYVQTMNNLLHGQAVLAATDQRAPKSSHEPNELEIPAFCAQHCGSWFNHAQLDGWWLPDQPRMPRGAQWDLLSTCEIKGKRGLLLVEAKAHEGELDFKGKQLEPTASSQSELNHQHISDCLSAVSQQLNKSKVQAEISADSHYQLANRVAWAWKLADCGVPVVLLYLGFVGDTHFKDHLRDSNHWQRTVGAYMHGILPLNLPGAPVPGQNGGKFTLLVESLPVP